MWNDSFSNFKEIHLFWTCFPSIVVQLPRGQKDLTKNQIYNSIEFQKSENIFAFFPFFLDQVEIKSTKKQFSLFILNGEGRRALFSIKLNYPYTLDTCRWKLSLCQYDNYDCGFHHNPIWINGNCTFIWFVTQWHSLWIELKDKMHLKHANDDTVNGKVAIFFWKICPSSLATFKLHQLIKGTQNSVINTQTLLP